MITYSLELKDNEIKFSTNNREFLLTAYDMLKIIAEAIAYRNSVMRVARTMENEKGE